ncbi:hypothetical protein KCU78_g3458, partial [Aureobasidium melanogenum]
MSEIVTILTGACYVANIIGLPLPWCPGGNSGDTNQIVKALVATSKLGAANSNIAQGGIEQPYAESPLTKAIQIIQSQPFPGLTALSEEELDKFLAGLEAPKATTMLTVPVSMPTKRSTIQATHHDPDVSDEEKKELTDEERRKNWRKNWWRCPYGIPCWPLPPDTEQSSSYS